ncbi:hypothetical protein [Rhizobium phage RHph_X2_28B]|uniref:hypothetical protein n=1 Tax=Rhizobium phage RHph_X2_28B TaxID=2836086 RepID=UPI0023298A5F|nr:hypothetical protein PP751_gp067 [Rhizobium phage RHph_X2_28B]QWY83519.1 hypothetical protein [Rhizobium phage RHph_X2_28B]QWY83755.1 hypothetical protein [Rhizobium phage RHph_X3_15]
MTYVEILSHLTKARRAIEYKLINFDGDPAIFRKLEKATHEILHLEIVVAQVDDELKKGA